MSLKSLVFFSSLLYTSSIFAAPRAGLPASDDNSASSTSSARTLALASPEIGFEEIIPQHLPKEIGKLGALKKLNVRDTTLQELPDKIGDLKSLIKLALESNKLTSLPHTIWNNDLRGIYLNSLQVVNDEEKSDAQDARERGKEEA